MTDTMWAVEKDGKLVPGILANSERTARKQACKQHDWYAWEYMEALGYRTVKVKMEKAA